MSSYFLLDLVPLSLALVLPECSGAGKDWDESLQKAQKLSFGKDKNCLGNQQKIALAIIELTWCFLVLFYSLSSSFHLLLVSKTVWLNDSLPWLSFNFSNNILPFFQSFFCCLWKNLCWKCSVPIVSVDDIQIFVYSNLSPFQSKNKHIKWNISHKINQTYSNWIFSRNCAH